MTKLMFDDLDAKRLRAVADFYETKDLQKLVQNGVVPVIEERKKVGEPDRLIGFEKGEWLAVHN